MDIMEKASVMQFHRSKMLCENDLVRVLGWKDHQSQQKRFEALCSLADLSNSIVMDLGCGTGDLKTYLDTQFKNFIFLGIDHLPEFIATANRNFADAINTYFFQADFITDGFPEVDYIVASGALSYRCDNVLFPYTIIRKMYEHARKGVAFNLLDNEHYTSDSVLKSYNRYEVLGYCLRLAERAELITGYLPDDFTILMYK